ncbi:hypothetical protein RBXJA2T_13799 [Rubrivivax benzoatilyticus JA2 = ATCC BAA-35]|nr:hypothetical protein RBXJA2T_13799 [Rubrivivax benzoatilyticus JA2 = ATCC BAA-35]
MPPRLATLSASRHGPSAHDSIVIDAGVSPGMST